MHNSGESGLDPLEQQQLTQTRSSLGTFWHRCRSDLATRLIRKTRARRVLDVGAGAGLLGTWLARHAPEIEYRFFEPNPRLAEALSRRFSPAQAVAADQGLPDVDAVVLLDVIEHIPDDHVFLGSLAARMRPGALLVVTVPAMPSLFSAWDEAMGHHRRYSKRSLQGAVSGLPLEVSECSYFFPELLPAAVWRRVTRPRATEVSPEFPELPGAADRAFFRIGQCTSRARRLAPLGTSLLLVARRID
jgi:SAM-dependent methyltransferase